MLGRSERDTVHARSLGASILVLAVLEVLPAHGQTNSPPIDRGPRQRAVQQLADPSVPDQSLPFDPMTFQAPPNNIWEELRDRRLWAAAVVEAVVSMGLFQRDHATHLLHLAEALARHPELNWDVQLRETYGKRLRFQLKEVHGGPYATVVLTW